MLSHPSKRTFHPLVVGVMAVAILLTQVVARPAHGRPDETGDTGDRAGGRDGGLVSAQARTPDEIVLGVLEPERGDHPDFLWLPQPVPGGGMAAPGCAQPPSRERREAPGCSEEAKVGGPQQGADGFKGGPGCAIQCIKTGVAYAKGPGATLVVETDTPAQIVLNVVGPGFAGAAASGPGATKFVKDFLELEANSTYTVNAFATDTAGYTSKASGTFTTLRRFTTADFGAFQIAETASCCDNFDFHFKVGDGWLTHLTDLNYGLPVLPGALPGARAATVEDAPQWLYLAVQVVQATHEDPACDGEGSNFPLDAPLSGTSGGKCGVTWNTAFNTIDLDLRPPGATSWFEHERTVWLPAFETLPNETLYSPLRFTAPVFVKVWYGVEP